jgi:four helix bundle protein
MTKEEMKARTKAYNIAVIDLCNTFPKTTAGYEIAKQLIRSAGSVGANYRAACRAKSTAAFIYKLEIVIEEADETCYWLELSNTLKFASEITIATLLKEADELLRILVATVKTVKQNNKKV